VALNCAAIPSTLLESGLFGYERGAFTGAVAQTIGRFQAADRGTLFLDEIGDLPLELQPKLLRALQEKQFERLGGGHTLNVDVRVIAATNQNLAQMVQERKFRADLYYRLNVFPLRERRDDIRMLAEHFVRKFASEQGKSIATIPEDMMEALEAHHWPGNVRELQNVIERGVIMTTSATLSRQTIEPLTRGDAAPVHAPAAGRVAPIKTMADAERAHITRTLRETNGVVGGKRGAAAQLGLPRTTLLARMQRLGISSGMSETHSAPDLRVTEAVAG
jgi:transcriptional regulator with GAF, ATPase, and Fis domain